MAKSLEGFLERRRKRRHKDKSTRRRVRCNGRYHYVSLIGESIILHNHDWKKERALIQMGGATCPCIEFAYMVIRERQVVMWKPWRMSGSNMRTPTGALIQSATTCIDRRQTDPLESRIHRIIYLILRYELQLNDKPLYMTVNIVRDDPTLLRSYAAGFATREAYRLVFGVPRNWIESVWKAGLIKLYKMIVLARAPFEHRPGFVTASLMRFPRFGLPPSQYRSIETIVELELPNTREETML
jgi:hypothetical protein